MIRVKYNDYNENKNLKEETIMNYELLLEDVKEVSKDKLKEIAFNVERSHWDKIHELQEAMTKELCQLSKDRTFFEMLLINSLKEE